MSKSIKFYYYGDVGLYDNWSPSYILSREKVPEIIYLIASYKPYTLGPEDIKKSLGINAEVFDKSIKGLIEINAVDGNEQGYKLNFPVFLERDIGMIAKHLANIGDNISKLLIEKQDFIKEQLGKLRCSRYFSTERILYHVICDYIFDGTAFDFWGAKGVICTSKQQAGERDYIIFGYEDSEAIEAYSNKLLCSSNNYKTGRFTFNSFGDSRGNRKDVYRFFRLMEKGLEKATPFTQANFSYGRLWDKHNRAIMNECGEFLVKVSGTPATIDDLNEWERDICNFLLELEYLRLDKHTKELIVNIPMLYEEDLEAINNISTFILMSILDCVQNTLVSFQNSSQGMTFVEHRIDVKEAANELWHQIFGSINEGLIKKGLVEKPQHKDGEGRYLSSLWVHE